MFRVTAYTRVELPAEKNITGEDRHEIIRIAKICTTPKSRKELMTELGLKHQDHFREAYLLPALETGMIE
jgi:ATP-dependent DNA helicase RecG